MTRNTRIGSSVIVPPRQTDGSTSRLIVYNALSVRPGVYDGGATYSLNVLRHLPGLLPDDRLLVYCREGEDRVPGADNVEVREIPIRSAAHRALVETATLARIDADVFVSPNESLPARLPAPTVVVAQNLAYHCPRIPDGFRGGSFDTRLRAAAQAAYYRRRMPEAYRRATAVVPISRTAADLLVRQASLDPAKTVVALGGSDSMFLEPRPAEAHQADRLLIVSAIAPYKNFDAVVAALATLRARRPAVTVDVAGPDWHGYREVVEAKARDAGVADAIRFLGALGPSEIAQLYASSTLLLHLSECEACPLPPIEAMRGGLPVVAARRSSIPEVVADGALLVDPADPAAVAAAVERLLADEPELEALRARGRARAAELTWKATAAGVAEAVRRASRARP